MRLSNVSLAYSISSSVWLCTKSGELCLGRSYRYYSLACALKQRMLNFVQNLLNYMTFEVFESSWNAFEENIKNVNNIDDVIRHHTNFLDTCLRDCIVTSNSFQNIHQILCVCKFFSDFVQSITQYSKEKEETAKFDFKVDSKLAKEKRKAALKVNCFRIHFHKNRSLVVDVVLL